LKAVALFGKQGWELESTPTVQRGALPFSGIFDVMLKRIFG